MNLHHADKADWETVPSDEWNGWQRLAARTGGIVAPANFISLVGAIVAFYGIHLIWVGQVIAGAIVLVLGRVSDILDGMVADHTRTKSPFGEGFDATLDKVVILLSLVVIFWQSLLPWPVFLTLVFFNAYNAIIGYYGNWMKKSGSHPSRSGKLSSAFAWIAIGSLVAATQITARPWHEILVAVGIASFIVYLPLAANSSYSYTKAAFGRKL
jgi:phosphatidylglycerophosphate synthase